MKKEVNGRIPRRYNYEQPLHYDYSTMEKRSPHYYRVFSIESI